MVGCLIGNSCVLVGKWPRDNCYFVLCIHYTTHTIHYTTLHTTLHYTTLHYYSLAIYIECVHPLSCNEQHIFALPPTNLFKFLYSTKLPVKALPKMQKLKLAKYLLAIIYGHKNNQSHVTLPYSDLSRM